MWCAAVKVSREVSCHAPKNGIVQYQVIRAHSGDAIDAILPIVSCRNYFEALVLT